MKNPRNRKKKQALSYPEKYKLEREAKYVGIRGTVIGFNASNVFFIGRLEGKLKGEEIELKRSRIGAKWSPGKRFEITGIDPGGQLTAQLL